MKCECNSIDILKGAEAQEYANEHLVEVEADSTQWKIEYVCPKTDQKFIMEYPQSEYHGGGPPLLRKIKPDHSSDT
jgi:hypothetical protein